MGASFTKTALTSMSRRCHAVLPKQSGVNDDRTSVIAGRINTEEVLDDIHPPAGNCRNPGGERLMKTLAIRLEEDLHAQLSVLAQLRNSTITDEIRQAIEEHIEASKLDPELKGRGQAVLDDIERDAKTRQAAIATLFGTTEQPPATPELSLLDGPSGKPAGKRASTRTSE